MRLEPFHLSPNLSLIIYWNQRMNKAMRKRYWAAMHNLPEATDQLREEYAHWGETQDAAYEQVKRFYALTGSYPVSGDELHSMLREPSSYYPGLRITKRILFTSFSSEIMQLIYEVEGEEIGMEELEEYQEGDQMDDDD
ncbi:hypothetical protein [Hymenobacter negativus]|uniref:DUF4288 domain-containing protein n=1 Tax=Hymenobacter negativus TaxID=2795026 RepID=A0ABS0QA70_9BACT|nr:hypothetical protein [Hymenobacter negativus]MBH8559233.1 hypothetical protein [Hymenobacter negativus]